MRENSELAVITKSKNLIQYIFLISDNAPKKYRFSLVSKMQNLSMDIMEALIEANEILLGNSIEEDKERKNLQHKALAKLRVLDAVAMVAREHQCILPRQHEMMSRCIHECVVFICAWMNSDKKRYKSVK